MNLQVFIQFAHEFFFHPALSLYRNRSAVEMLLLRRNEQKAGLGDLMKMSFKYALTLGKEIKKPTSVTTTTMSGDY